MVAGQRPRRSPIESLEVRAMTIFDPNELSSSDPDSPSSRRGNGQNGESDRTPRPFGDIDNLFEIPRVQPDDPPLREWWIDDEFADERLNR